MKIKFATKTMKSIWLIRHGEKDPTKIYCYTKIYKERNYEWKLSETGVTQSRRVATVLKEKYKNFTNLPLIFVSPFKRTIQTGLYTACYINSTLKIEEGLLEKHHGLWDRTKMLDYFSNNLQFFDMDYQSRFPATKDKISPFIWKANDAFDRSVAYYFIEMLQKGDQDIIIFGHQTELYNIQKVITGDIGLHGRNREFEKLGYASMFQYVLNPQSWRLELKSYFKVPDLL